MNQLSPSRNQLSVRSMIARLGVLALILWIAHVQASAAVADFEDLTLASNSYYNGSDGGGDFVSRGFGFNNSHTDWGGGFYSWNGFAYSNINDSVTPGYGNQYAAAAGTGVGGSGIYAVSFVDAFGALPMITLPIGHTGFAGLFVSNTTYAFLSMLNGDSFAKKFGGASGDDPDWFKLTATGADGAVVTGTLDFYLADFRSPDSASDYILNDWTWFDLSGLGGATSVTFGLSSSDNGTFGMNTPSFFALDDVQAVPEPATMLIVGIGLAAVARRRRALR